VVIYATDTAPNPFAAGFLPQNTSACAPTSVYVRFIPSGTGPLQSLTVPLRAVQAATAIFDILNDNAGSPGVTVLDTITFTGVTTTPTMLTANSTLNPVLVAGTAYWLRANAPVCTPGNQNAFIWYFSTPNLVGTVAINGTLQPAQVIPSFSLLGLASIDSVINFTNTGANNAQDICVNTYTFAPDEQLISCCSCRVTRNALWSLAVKRDLASNTLTPAVENSVVVKLLATAAPASGSCNPALPGARVPGLAAWGTTFHLQNGSSGTPYASETPFTNSTLSTAEQNVMTSLCGFIQSNGSGYGICRSCQGAGGGRIPIGASSQNRGLSAERQ